MPDESRKPDPFSYLPVRISKGSIQPAGLEIALIGKTELLAWADFRLICLGIVDEPVFDPDPFMQGQGAFEKLFSTEKERPVPKKRRNIYIEMFTCSFDRPLRIEAGLLDYRSFLGNAEPISIRNLKKFLEALILRMSPSVFDSSYRVYLKNEKDPALFFPNVYEFQRSCQERFRKVMEQS